VLAYEFMFNGTLHDRSPMAPSVMLRRGRLNIALADDVARVLDPHLPRRRTRLRRSPTSATFLLTMSAPSAVTGHP
jgi:hypothetical protein